MLIGSGIIISGKRRLNVTQLISGRNIQATVLSMKVEKKQLYELVDFLKYVSKWTESEKTMFNISIFRLLCQKL